MQKGGQTKISRTSAKINNLSEKFGVFLVDDRSHQKQAATSGNSSLISRRPEEQPAAALFWEEQ